ncbi:uncharacterized protein LOC116343537 [Contarinia nasturtii]|uniref:uncharacterized protein LOC116343537 n=1 Tax=Contarinia nasturtii TaxID=265458 RepID=UPI0012D41591|nr:uncharacterized protein LOC116343537 [Contarinia nasturtii]
MNVKILLLVCALITVATGGPIGAGICYAGCAAVVVACFSAAGAVFGATGGAAIAASPALVGCNSAFGVCEAACVAALVAPTP